MMCMRLQRAGSSWSKYLSRQTFVGTPNYMAPEIMVQSEEGYNQSAGEPPCTTAIRHIKMWAPHYCVFAFMLLPGRACCLRRCLQHPCVRFWHGEGTASLAASPACSCGHMSLQTSGPLGWCCWSWREARCPWPAAPSPRSSWTQCMAMHPACRRVAAHTATQKRAFCFLLT